MRDMFCPHPELAEGPPIREGLAAIISGRPFLVTSLRGRQEEDHHSQPQAPSLQPPRLTNDYRSISTPPRMVERFIPIARMHASLHPLPVWSRGRFTSSLAGSPLSEAEMGTNCTTTIPNIGFIEYNLAHFAACNHKTSSVMARRQSQLSWPT